VGIVLGVEAKLSPVEPQRRSPEEVHVLFHSADDLVGRVVQHLRASGIHADVNELEAFGRQGLIEAAHRFDADIGGDFRRFAYFRVRGAMLDGLRKMNDWSRRGYERVSLLRKMNDASEAGEPTAAQAVSAAEAAEKLRAHMAAMVTAMTIGVFADHALQNDGVIVPLDGAPNAEEKVADQEMVRIVREAMGSLPPPEDEVIHSYYVCGERMDDIADRMGCSKSWVSRVHSRALKRLGPRLRFLGQ
jgi:RNA polymerase sigma factor for flagellar operon FliA